MKGKDINKRIRELRAINNNIKAIDEWVKHGGGLIVTIERAVK